MASEDKVLAKAKRILRDYKIFYMRCCPSNGIGMPDLVACVNGKFVGIEVKDDINGSYGVTDAQYIRLEHIVRCGGIGVVLDADTVEELNYLIERGMGCGQRYGYTKR